MQRTGVQSSVWSGVLESQLDHLFAALCPDTGRPWRCMCYYVLHPQTGGRLAASVCNKPAHICWLSSVRVLSRWAAAASIRCFAGWVVVTLQKCAIV
jgi:hypothetical protein